MKMGSGVEMLYADHLLLISTAVIYGRSRGCKFEISTDFDQCNNSGALRYASRIDFFRLLGLQEPSGETFKRRPGMDRFTEISPYNTQNYIQVGRRVCQVVIAHISVDKAVQHMLDFCLFEIMDNVLVHAAFPAVFGGHGWCCAQYFPLVRQIRLMIADTGIGIHRALTRHPQSMHKGLSEAQSLSTCVEKGVTNGEGMGYGLYATLEFVRHNRGELLIYSGNYFLSFKEGRFLVRKGAYWQGTIVFMRILTDVPVDYPSFMPENYPLAADFDFFLGQSSDE